MREDSTAEQFFAVVIGTGFGGAVTACRLVQALGLLNSSQKICVLERGRRYASSDFPDLPKPPFALPDDHRWLWQSNQGLFDARQLGGCGILQAAGYGGGSLIYANVHLRAPDAVFGKWPKGITRKRLDPYYDLVAAMLDIRPFGGPLEKTGILEKAAKKCGVTTFRPPIAVSFADGKNSFGREQKACKNCGACCVGCPNDAKNTLDRNYLAEVERFPNIAEIRTLCEVVAISEVGADDYCESARPPAEPDGADTRYEILYRDFTRRERLFRSDEERRRCSGPEYHRINAKYVFVCGGAVNTTQLLMRSRYAHKVWRKAKESGKPTEGLPFGLSRLSDRLGQSFFPNADAIAMVFDTKEPVNPSVGPTITTAAVFGQGKKWFLVEDGAYPEQIRHFFDMAFRSDLLLDSNRFVTDTYRRTRANGDEFEWPQAEHEDPATLGRAPNIIDGLSTALAEGALGSITPEEFDRSFLEWWRFFRAAFDSRVEIKPVIKLVMRGLSRNTVAFIERCLPNWLRRMMGIRVLKYFADLSERIATSVYAFFCISHDLVFKLTRPALDRSFQIRTPKMLINHGDRILMDALSGRLGPARPGVPSGTLLPPAIGAGGKKNPWNHRLLLLVMGRDDRPFKLRAITRQNSSLDELRMRVELPKSGTTERTGAHDVRDARRLLLQSLGPRERRASDNREAWGETTYTAEELFLRDLASAMEGELRTNPLWTLGQVPMTAHSQGGCAMSDHEDGVTNAHGEVRKHPGLFVNDGSLFPISVGVNPSSTIAALAERNIEHFIRKTLKPDWEAPERGEPVRKWKARAEAEDYKLEPPDVDPVSTVAKPLGIEFTEKMQGFFVWKSPPPDPRAAEEFFRAEVEGRTAGCTIDFEVLARVEDIEAFMRDPTRDIVFTKGSLTVEGCRAIVEGGTMNLLVEDGLGRRRMDYIIVARAGDAKYTLTGSKYLRNEPGFGAWACTSILFSKIKKETTSGKIEGYGYGVLRVMLDEFMFRSVPSFRVTNSGGDEAREVQTLLSFMRFFVGGLENIYSPGIARATTLFRKRGAS